MEKTWRAMPAPVYMTGLYSSYVLSIGALAVLSVIDLGLIQKCKTSGLSTLKLISLRFLIL